MNRSKDDLAIEIAKIAATILAGSYSNPGSVNGYKLTIEDSIHEAIQLLLGARTFGVDDLLKRLKNE